MQDLDKTIVTPVGEFASAGEMQSGTVDDKLVSPKLTTDWWSWIKQQVQSFSGNFLLPSIKAAAGKLNILKIDENGLLSSENVLSNNTQNFIDINRYGFLNQIETTISFNDSTFIFTLADAGSGWSYYRAGIKYTITGNKTINLTTVENPLVNGTKYYIYINSTDGTLSASKTVWTLNDTLVPVAIVSWFSTNTPKYFLQEERHSCLIDRRTHLYLHNTRGTQYITGAELTGYTITTNTDAANTFAIGQSVIADEDIYLTLAQITDGNGTDASNYMIMHRSGIGTWTWSRSAMPFSFTTNGYINWDNAGTLTQGTGGAGGAVRYYNTYLVLTNTQGEGRYIFVAGQNEYTSAANAYAEVFANFDLTGFPKTEWCALYQFTWATGLNSLTNKGKCQLARAPQRITTSAITASSTTAVAHNSLSGLQGGQAAQYYHLTLSEYSKIAGGFIDYNDSGTPISYTTGSPLKLTNDGAGAYTLTTYKPYGVTSLWNTITNQFNFSELSLGDEVNLRISIDVTTTAPNQEFHMYLNMAIGGTAYSLYDGTYQFKSAGSRQIIVNMPFYIGNADTITYPAELMFSSDANATILMNGFYISVRRRIS